MSRDHYSTQGPICPYCLHQAAADEPGYYDESASTDECGSCGKTYSMSVYISTSWTTEALPDESITPTTQERQDDD